MSGFTLCYRIQPPEHFKQKYQVDEVHFVDEVRVGNLHEVCVEEEIDLSYQLEHTYVHVHTHAHTLTHSHTHTNTHHLVVCSYFKCM